MIFNNVINSIQRYIRDTFLEKGFQITVLERDPVSSDYEKMRIPSDLDYEEEGNVKLPALFMFYNGHQTNIDDLSGVVKRTNLNIGFDLYGFSRSNNVDITELLESAVMNKDFDIIDNEGNSTNIKNCFQDGVFESIPVIDEELIKFQREDIVEFSGSFDTILIN